MKSKLASDQEIEEVSTIIDKTEWYRQATASKLMFIGTPSLGVCDFTTYPTIYCFSKEFEGYYDLHGFNSDARELVKKSKNDPAVAQNIYLQFQQFYKKIKKEFDTSAEINFQTVPLSKIAAINQELDELNYIFWKEFFLGDVFDPEGDLILKEELGEYKPSQLELNDLIRPQKLNFIEESNLELSQIALKVLHNPNISEAERIKLLAPFAQKYFFIQNSWGMVLVLTAKDFLSPLKEIVSQGEERVVEMIRHYQNLEQNTKNKVEDITQKYAFSSEAVNIINLYRMIATIRDERKELVLLFNQFMEEICKRYAAEFGVKLSIVERALPFELTNIKNKEDMNLLKVQLEKRNAAIIARLSEKSGGESNNNNNNKSHKNVIIFGEKAQKYINQIHKKLTSKFESLQGRVACRGKSKVRGKVKIILGETHFTKFQEGDILVAPMTRPEYIPLMKKAKGIITDEGGITCHAAIASRELNVPCIIGTSVATKKLFDNREVEMDMETGNVTLL